MKKMIVCIIAMMLNATVVCAQDQEDVRDMPHSEHESIVQYKQIFEHTGIELIRVIYDLCEPDKQTQCLITVSEKYVQNDQSSHYKKTSQLKKFFSGYFVDLSYKCIKQNKNENDCIQMFHTVASGYKMNVVNGTVIFVQ